SRARIAPSTRRRFGSSSATRIRTGSDTLNLYHESSSSIWELHRHLALVVATADVFSVGLVEARRAEDVSAVEDGQPQPGGGDDHVGLDHSEEEMRVVQPRDVETVGRPERPAPAATCVEWVGRKRDGVGHKLALDQDARAVQGRCELDDETVEVPVV